MDTREKTDQEINSFWNKIEFLKIERRSIIEDDFLNQKRRKMISDHAGRAESTCH